MHEAFLSHARDSLPAAEAICHHLEAHGVPCWLAQRDAPLGAHYAESIVRAIHASRAVIVLISPGANASEHVLQEVERAWERGLRLIPVRLEPIALEGGLSYFLGSRTFLDTANPPASTDLERLLQEIRGLSVPSSKSARASTAADRPALAVLPFRSPGKARDQAYLSEGIADDLVDRLSRLRALPVLPATRPREGDIHATCAHLRHKLGVEYVLEGSVQRKSGRLHVHARLIETATGCELWGQVYDADSEDILRVQEEISDAIAGQMGAEVLDRERDRSIRLDGSELGSWERLLRADWYARRLDRTSNRTARALYEQLIEADPRLAAAHGGAAMTHVYDVIMGWSESPEASLSLAVAAAERAVEEDDRLPSAHLALGAASLLAGDPKRSLHESDRARRLYSAYPLAHWLHGTTLALL